MKQLTIPFLSGAGDKTALYIHVPFCVEKCRYCDFYSIASAKIQPLIHRYLLALEEELSMLPSGFQPPSIYLGGGTPSCLAEEELERLLGLVSRYAQISADTEFTCELNPGTISRQKLALLKKHGVNRVSLGVQSFSDEALAFLGRIHSRDDVLSCVDLIRETGFDQVSMDLMYGLPEPFDAHLEEDLDFLQRLSPEHLSCYCLTLEPGTPLYRDWKAGCFCPLDADLCRSQYDLIRSTLTRYDYVHYEISNFSKKGQACRHNLVYWNGDDYVGAGPGAHSFVNGRRYSHVADIEQWITDVSGGKIQEEPALSPEQSARELLVMGLRKLDGVCDEVFHRKTGYHIEQLCGERIPPLCAEEMLSYEGDVLRLTGNALFVSNAIMSELI